MKYFQEITKVKFPQPDGVDINMMPFIMGDHLSIPEEYRQYSGIIDACDIPLSEQGKVGYLTIHESFVEKGNSQRRGGIHTERHPNSRWGWGSGRTGRMSSGGIYMGSNIPNSCMIWDYLIEEPGPHGDCSHLRDVLENGVPTKENTIYWITDSTPHEALPLDESQYRQFFRVVTSRVDMWFSQHSTENRLGIEPNCKIIDHDKFEEISSYA